MGQIALMMLGLLIVMVISGVPLSFSMMFLAVTFGLIYHGSAILPLFVQNTFGVMQNEILIAVPLFVFMGCILERSGAAERLFTTLFKILGPVRGGLAIATILISTIFAACTGVIAASVTTMALIAMPAMLNRKYDKGIATGVVCAGGALGILIPPSVMLVMLGPMANLSVARLFAGALIPGLVLSALYVFYIGVRCIVQPEACPAISKEERTESAGKLFLEMVLYMLPIIFLLLAVIGSILAGITSPTEASSLGVVGALIIALGYKSLNMKTLRESVYETLKITSMIFFVIVAAKMFTSVFLYMRGGDFISRIILNLPLSKWSILGLMMFTVFILGMFIDWIGILYIVVPIFMPIAIRLGFDPLWFALLISINLQMSFLTPPFAYSIFFVKGVAPSYVSTTDIYSGIVPFILLQMIGLVLCIVFPQLILWLPSLGG